MVLAKRSFFEHFDPLGKVSSQGHDYDSEYGDFQKLGPLFMSPHK